MENQNPGEEKIDFSKSHLKLSTNLQVFEKVLSYLSHSDKANVRLVCKQWEESSRPTWRSNSTLQIDGMLLDQSDDEDNISTVSQSKRLTMKQFLEQVRHAKYNVPSDPLNLFEYPFRKLEIYGDSQRGIGIMDDIEAHFWNIIGPGLKYLHLNEVSFPPSGATQFHRILSELTPNLIEFVYTQRDLLSQPEPVLADEIGQVVQPNLTSLTINLTTVDYLSVYHAWMNAYVDRIGGIENAESAHLYDHQHIVEAPDIEDEEFYFVNLMRYQDGRYEFGEFPPPVPVEHLYQNMIPFDWKRLLETFPNLKHVDNKFRQPDYDHRHACTLVRKEFLVNQLSLIGEVRRERPNTLNIESWNGNLFGAYVINRFCKLSLPIRSFAGNFEQTCDLSFRHFVTTHEATLKEIKIHPDEYQAFSSEKDLWLPAGLTNLQMDRPWGDCLDFLKHVPNLETLIFHEDGNPKASFSSSFGGQGVVQPLARMKEFRCKINLSSQTFNQIVFLMPNLRKLTIGMGNDELITASLTWNELEFLEIFHDYFNKDVVLDERVFVQCAFRFEKLKTFIFEQSDRYDGEMTHFGELSIYEGFLKMPQLQTVKIKFSSEVTAEAIAALKARIPRVEILD